MRIGIIASHIYRPDDEELSHITTGLAITLYDIISHYTLGEEVLYFTTTQRVKGKQYNNMAIVDTDLNISNICRGISLNSIMMLLRMLPKYGAKVSLKEVYRDVMFKRCIQEMARFEPTIIHFHDLSEQTIRLLKYYENSKVKCILTLHIYIGKRDRKKLGERYYKLSCLEECALKLKNIYLSVISSGMRLRILHDYPDLDSSKITVIMDGTDGSRKKILGSKSGECFSSGKKILLCIGTIMKRKNQEQVLRSLVICKREYGDQCPMVLFLGNDTTDGEFEASIKNKKIEDVAKYIGCVPAEEIGAFYEVATGVISASKNEAFGLTFIEGFLHGIPCLYFNDIDSADDLFDACAVIKIKNRGDDEFAQGIMRLVKKKWDSNLIISHGEKFCIESTSKRYEQYYLEIEGLNHETTRNGSSETKK